MCQGVILMSRVFTWMALESFDEFPKFLVFEEWIFAYKCKNGDSFIPALG